jgi:hypothetical protein
MNATWTTAIKNPTTTGIATASSTVACPPAERALRRRAVPLVI